MITVRQRRLPGMDEPVAELAVYFRTKTRLSDQELARLTLEARAADSRWDAIAAACGITTCKDLADVIYRITGETGVALLFSAAQEAVWQLTGSERRCPPLTWACPGCALQVTDRAPAGRPVPVEHRHARPALGWPATRPPRMVGAVSTCRPDLGLRTRLRPGAAALAARADHRRLPALGLARVLPSLPCRRRRRLGCSGL
jgi:hypothetical protein